jgi:hypothetical protein
VAWKVSTPGRGWSSPIIVENQIWLTTAIETPAKPEDAERRLKVNTGDQPLTLLDQVELKAVCLDRQSGRLTQELSLITVREPQWVHKLNSYASPTPFYDQGKLYCHFGALGTACVDTISAKVDWVSSELTVMHENGPGGSPIVVGDLVVFHLDGSDRQLIAALDKKTGKMLWKSQSEEAGYSSPIAFDLGGARRLVVFTGEGAMGLTASNGELLWKYDKVANRTANVATPIFHDSHVFLSSDYGTGCALLRLKPEGGGVKAEEVYFSREMKNHYSSSVLVKDYLYGFSSAILTAMKFQTGEVAWRDRSVGKGSLIYADRHLYCLGETGVMGLVEASSEGYKEKSRFEIPRGEFPTWTPPAIAGGKLYLREQDNLYCYNIKQ